MSEPVKLLVEGLVPRLDHAESMLVGVKSTSGNYILECTSNMDLTTLRGLKRMIDDEIKLRKEESREN